MTNLHRPLSIGRAVAPMCILAYGGFARVATKLAQPKGWLAGCLAHARSSSLNSGSVLSLARSPLRYGTKAHFGHLDHGYPHEYPIICIDGSYGGLTSSMQAIWLWYHCNWADIGEVTTSNIRHGVDMTDPIDMAIDGP